MRIIGWLLGAAVALAIVFMGVIATLLMSEAGSNFTVRQILKYTPSIHISEMHGSFTQGMHFDQIVAEGDVPVTMEQVFVKVELWPLLDLRGITIETFSAQLITLGVSDTPSSNESTPALNDLELPQLPIFVQVNNAHIRKVRRADLQVDELTFSAHWGRQALRIMDASGTVMDVTMLLQARLSSGATPTFSLTADWQTETIRGKLQADGFTTLNVTHGLRGAGSAEIITSGQLDFTNLPQIRATLRHQAQDDSFNLKTEVAGQADSWLLGLSGEFFEQNLKLDAGIDIADTVRITVNEAHWAAWGIFSGFVGIKRDDLSLNATGQLTVPALDSTQFQVTANGNPDDLHLTLEGRDGHLQARLENLPTQPLISVEKASMSYQGVTLTNQAPFQVSSLSSGWAISSHCWQGAGQLCVEESSYESSALQLRGHGAMLPVHLLNSYLPAQIGAETTVSGKWELDFKAGNWALDTRFTTRQLALIHDGEKLNWLPDVTATLHMSDHDMDLALQGQTDQIELQVELSMNSYQPVQIADGIIMRGQATDFPAYLINHYLPAQFGEATTITGDWTVAFNAGVWELDTRMATQELSLIYADEQYSWLPDISTTLRLSEYDMDMTLQGESEQINLQAQLNTVGFEPINITKGEFHTEMDCALAPGLIDQIADCTGTLAARGKFSGDSTDPDFDMQGSWQAESFSWKSPALQLSAVDTLWQADNDGFKATGHARTESGDTLEFKAQGDGYSPSAKVTAAVTSAGLNLSTNDWTLTAVPQIDATLAEQTIEVLGQADIPFARVTWTTSPSSLPRPSRDVRISGRYAEPSEEARYSVQGRVDVTLGEDVRFDLPGLKARLQGKLTATIQATEISELYGELQVSAGTMQAAGQSLKVQTGRVVFSGDPQNPFIDIVATREVKTASSPLNVGIRISGNADRLESTLFSDPVMSETRILSYLVLGRDFNEQSTTDNQQLLNAAIGFGLSQSEGVVRQLRNLLGLDELAVLAAEQNNVAIIAGKRVTENLYVRYTYNALSAVGALVIRYYLGDRWRLEATNDANASMDLLYELNR